MSNNTHYSNSNSNQYTTLAVEDKEEVGSLHTISDDSSTTVQAIADDVEVQQLELEVKQLEEEEERIKQRKRKVKRLEEERINKELKIVQVWCNDKDKDLDFEDEEMTSVFPVLVMKEEYLSSIERVVVRADVQLFKDQISNALAKASHPHHSGGCAHLLDDIDRYRKRVGNMTAALPKITG